MNAACIIAACAAHSRAMQKGQKENFINFYLENEEFYYKVKLRKYYHFEGMTLVSPVEECYVGSIYAPIKQLELKTVWVPERSVGIEHSFYVNASKCPNGIDNYIKENLETYRTSAEWLASDKDVINKYVLELNKKYNISLSQESLTYTSQFCWEVCK